MKRCPSCGDENADRARFCQNCGTALAEPEERGGETRKVVTIVFADVTGSTALGERLDPEALRRVMGRYFDEMSAVIERHGGTVEKFIGDAVMAVFGIPQLHEDDALRAIRAAHEMRQGLAALNVDLERDHGVAIAARIGVNTGEVVAGDPGLGQRLVTGDAVNVAARLEQAASPGEVLLGETTFRLVRDAVKAEQVAPLDLKGKEEPLPAYRLSAVLEAPEGHARHLDSPLVGRAKELAMLERALERTLDERTCHLFTLLGPAGVGKSRLVNEFLEGPAARATVLRGRCLSYGEGITFYPLAEMVQEAAGVLQTDDVQTARSKLTASLAEVADGPRIVPLVAGLLSWGEPGPTEEAFWAVRKLLEHLALEGPLVLVVDDIHWAEPTFLELLDHLADWTRDAAILLLCVARPELLEIRPDWGGGKLNATSILLEPLDGEAMSLLVDNLLGRADLPHAARSRILEAAEGNPLFVEEMLGMLIDDGLLRAEPGGWVAVADLAEITVPPTIQLLLAARLDRLDSEERAVMERGSIEGKIFHTGAVTTLASDALRPHVRTRLLALARKELIRPDRAEFAGEDAFRFRHLLIRDAAYQAMPKEQRAELHERFATWLEHAAGDRLPEYEEILGHHLEQAYRYRLELGPPDERARALGAAAAERLLRSAERARVRGDVRSGRLLEHRAVELSEGSQRARALLELALSCAEASLYQEAQQHALDAAAAADAVSEPAIRARAALVRAESRGQTDPTYSLAQCVDDLKDALEELRGLGDDAGIVAGTLALARHTFYAGRAEECRRTALALREGAAARPWHIRRGLLVNLAVPLYFGPTPAAEAIEMIDDLRDLVQDSPLSEARQGVLRAGLLAMTGDEERTDAELARVGRLLEEIGDDASIFQPTGEAHRFLGRSDRAEEAFRRGRRHFDELGETGFNSTMTALHAQVLCDLGRFEEAETIAQRARALSAEDDTATQVSWRLGQARVCSSRGEHERAMALAAEARSLNASTDYVAWIGEGHEVAGDVFATAGRSEEARDAYEHALRSFEAKGVVRWAARVREKLAAADS